MMHLGSLAVGLVLFVSLVPAHAQSAGTVPKLGYLRFLNEPEASPFRDAFLRGLRDLGYVPGQNIIVDVRRWTTEGQLRQVLSELIRLKPDVIFVGLPFAALAAKQNNQGHPYRLRLLR